MTPLRPRHASGPLGSLARPLAALAALAASATAVAAPAAAPAVAVASPSLSQADAFLLLGLLPFVPAALLMMTAFTRIIIVFSLIRQALGLSTTPSSQILIGLSFILTLCVMEPVIGQIEQTSWKPWRLGEITLFDAGDRAMVPLREFMTNQIRPEALAVLYPRGPAPKIDDASMIKVTGAFALSELRTGFEIGILIFVPFLIIDVLVASILMSLGMMMLSPTMISLPLKLLVFVMIDGWVLVAGGLLGSFG
jgi:flagellar biosynthetic protein FliP